MTVARPRPLKVALVSLDNKVLPDFVDREMRQAGLDFVAAECETREQLARLAADAQIVWVGGGSQILTNGNLGVLPRCAAIIRTGSGTDNIPVAEATKRGILVANTPEAISEAVSEHALALILALVRHLIVMDREVRRGRMDHSIARPRLELRGKNLGLVGFGHIARGLARMVSGLEMPVLAYDPYVDAPGMAEAGVRKVSLKELLAQSDFVSLHCPLSKETYHFISEPQLRAMKPTAYLINTCRGPVVDEAALIRALENNWIAGAGLDVFEDEHAPANPALRTMDNVVLSPHMAGYAEENIITRWRLSVETVIDLANGRWPRSCVNPEIKTHWNNGLMLHAG